MSKKVVGYELGRKHEMEVKPLKNKVCYPRLTLSDEELPYLEEVEVGDKVSFLCLFQVVGEREEEGGKCYYDLELQKVAEDAEMKISKALEKFMGEHKEVDGEEDESKENEKD